MKDLHIFTGFQNNGTFGGYQVVINPHKTDTTLPSLYQALPEFFPQNNNYTSPINELPLSQAIEMKPTGYASLPNKDVNLLMVCEGGKKPRPRRRFDEIQRLYSCDYPGCTKSYGALNHLNSHIVSKGHGPRKLPSEFEEMRRRLRLLNEKSDKKN